MKDFDKIFFFGQPKIKVVLITFGRKFFLIHHHLLLENLRQLVFQIYFHHITILSCAISQRAELFLFIV